MRVSILITSRKGDPIRDKNLDWIVKRYKTLFPEYEIVLELDDKNSPLFHKASALNRAFKRSTGDVILQSDAEIFCPPKQIIEAISVCSARGWASPYTRLYKLNMPISKWIVEHKVNIAPPNLKEKRVDFYKPIYSIGNVSERPDCIYYKDFYARHFNVGYLIAIHRDAWLGYDERFMGWGYEDTAFYLSMKAFHGLPHWIKGNLYHLWHPLTIRQKSTEMGQIEKNRELYGQYKNCQNDKEAIRELLKQGQLNG